MDILRKIGRNYRHKSLHRRASSPARTLFGAFLTAAWLFVATAGTVAVVWPR